MYAAFDKLIGQLTYRKISVKSCVWEYNISYTSEVTQITPLLWEQETIYIYPHGTLGYWVSGFKTDWVAA